MTMHGKCAIIAGVSLAALTLGSCSDGPRGPGSRQAALYMDGIGGRGMMIRPGPSANQAYSDGMDLKSRGDCAGAVTKLKPVANLGPGYENAQFAVGDCLITIAGTPGGSQFNEGLIWLTRAADAGWTEAQGRLAQIYALGPEAQRNLDEAAVLLSLYRGGKSLARIGFTPLSATVEADIATAVGPERLMAAQPRIVAWQPKLWIPATPSPTPGPERSGRARGPMPPQGQ
jgi:hypothetical protein